MPATGVWLSHLTRKWFSRISGCAKTHMVGEGQPEGTEKHVTTGAQAGVWDGAKDYLVLKDRSSSSEHKFLLKFQERFHHGYV